MRTLGAIGSLALLLAFGCSTGEEGGDVTVPQAPTDDASSPSASARINDHGTKTFTTEAFDVELELDNFYFEPTNIKSPGGATAMVDLHNEGSAPHTFTAPDLDIDVELEPGASKEIEVEIGTETRYEFYCRFHGDSGMRGSFQPH